MPNSIKPKRSYTTNSIPRAEDLEPHELAINWTDGRIFAKDTAGNIVTWSLGSQGSAGLLQTGRTSRALTFLLRG